MLGKQIQQACSHPLRAASGLPAEPLGDYLMEFKVHSDACNQATQESIPYGRCHRRKQQKLAYG